MRSSLLFTAAILILNPFPSAAQSTDCGLASGTVSLTTQSDIDSISGCNTIYGELYISLGVVTTSIENFTSPENFTLPSGLESVEGMMYVQGISSPTTSFLAPNLKIIGYGGGNSTASLVRGLSINTFLDPGLISVSFPALTKIEGPFLYNANSEVTNLAGFPLLANVSDSLTINGSFHTLELPALVTVANEGGGEIVIESSSSSFQCPSNITPELVPYGSCVICEYNPPHTTPNATCNLGQTSTGTAAVSGTSAANTAATSLKPSASAIKTSEAFSLTGSDLSIYGLMIFGGWLFHWLVTL